MSHQRDSFCCNPAWAAGSGLVSTAGWTALGLLGPKPWMPMVSVLSLSFCSVERLYYSGQRLLDPHFMADPDRAAAARTSVAFGVAQLGAGVYVGYRVPFVISHSFLDLFWSPRTRWKQWTNEFRKVPKPTLANHVLHWVALCGTMLALDHFLMPRIKDLDVEAQQEAVAASDEENASLATGGDA